MAELNKAPSKLNDGHKKLAQTLIALHQHKNPYSLLPEYEYKQLQKGIYCKSCKSFSIKVKGYHIVCEVCGGQEIIQEAIFRNVQELKLLFPDHKITTQSAYEWCNSDFSIKTINRVLQKNYNTTGNKRNTYYK